MADEGATKDPAGQQPDFKKGWETATQTGGMKPPEQSETATPATEPESELPEPGQRKAADILKDNAEKDTGSAA